MTVQVLITAATAKNVILVPKAAVFLSPEAGHFVMVAGSDNMAHQKTVQLGLLGAADTQIKSGIAAGESVIVSGGYGLPDKTKIKIEAAPAKEDSAKSGDQSDEAKGDKSSAPDSGKE
jgi:membrane fusion protein (multidrug efflux system)